jgi:ABC-type lipoprotein release transport system permease subunit
MRFNILSLSYKLLRAKKLQYFLVFFGVFIGTALFYMFLSVQYSLKESWKNIFSNTLNIVSIEKNPQNNISIDLELKKQIESLPEVKKVYEESALILPFSFEIPIPFSKNFSLDLYFMYGIDDELFFQIQEFSYDENDIKNNSIPILLNPLSLDIINSFIQSVANGVVVSNDLFIKKNINVEFGKSTFLPAMSKKKRKTSQLFVSGFSSFSPMVGVAMPLSEIRKLQKFFGVSSKTFSKFHILANENVTQDELKKILEKMNLKVKLNNIVFDKIYELTGILQATLIFSSSVTLLLAFFFLFSILQLVLIENKKTIGILQSI